MAMPGRPGGRQFDDDIRNIALAFMGIFLLVFFLLAVRVYFDKASGKKVAPLKPTRNAAPLIKRAAQAEI